MNRERYSIHNSRLIPSEIPGLRERIKGKLTTVYQEADRYGVGTETIRRAVRGETFRNVRDGLPEDGAPIPDRRLAEPKIAPDEINKSLERLTRLQEENADPDGSKAVDLFLNARKDKK